MNAEVLATELTLTCQINNISKGRRGDEEEETASKWSWG